MSAASTNGKSSWICSSVQPEPTRFCPTWHYSSHGCERRERVVMRSTLMRLLACVAGGDPGQERDRAGRRHRRARLPGLRPQGPAVRPRLRRRPRLHRRGRHHHRPVPDPVFPPAPRRLLLAHAVRRVWRARLGLAWRSPEPGGGRGRGARCAGRHGWRIVLTTECKSLRPCRWIDG
jgi:hypothetical protein